MAIITPYDPCLCGSGKKLKFCCSGIGRESDLKELAHSLGKLPIHSCYIGENWKNVGITYIFIAKTLPSRKLVIGMYLVDIWCLGVKDAELRMNMDESYFHSVVTRGRTKPIEYEDARSIIFGGLAYAHNLDFAPHPDWHRAKALVEPDRSFEAKYTFGRDGSPFYCAGPYDVAEKNVREIVRKVEKAGGNWVIPVED